MRDGWVLGIDFGTSNTAAAIWRPGSEPVTVALSSDATQMPSGVFADPAGEIRTGPSATRSAFAAPERYERCPKSRIVDGTVALGESEFQVVDLVAAVLRNAASRATSVAGGTRPSRVVLTHPAQWARTRTDALREAGARAGLGPVDLLPEPVAAASWYLRSAPLPPGSLVGVFDFGGGTCDVATLRTDPGGVFVHACDGEDFLGGEQLDRRLTDWALDRVRDQDLAALAGEVAAEPTAWLSLQEQIRGAKHALSDYESTQIVVRAGSGRALVDLDRTTFETLIEPEVDRAVDLMRRVITSSGVVPSALARLYLTGGSSSIPLVQRRLADLLGQPVATLGDPKLVVALGASSPPLHAPPPPARLPQSPPPPAAVPPPTRTPPPGPAPSRPGRRRGLVAGVVAGVLLVGAAVGVGATRLDGSDDRDRPGAALTALYPDLTGDVEGVDCAAAEPAFELFPAATIATMYECTYADAPEVTVFYAQWDGPTYAAARWVEDFRIRGETPVDQFTKWVHDDTVRGPYFAGSGTGAVDEVRVHRAEFNDPYSATVVAPTLEAAEAHWDRRPVGAPPEVPSEFADCFQQATSRNAGCDEVAEVVFRLAYSDRPPVRNCKSEFYESEVQSMNCVDVDNPEVTVFFSYWPGVERAATYVSDVAAAVGRTPSEWSAGTSGQSDGLEFVGTAADGGFSCIRSYRSTPLTVIYAGPEQATTFTCQRQGFYDNDSTVLDLVTAFTE